MNFEMLFPLFSDQLSTISVKLCIGVPLKSSNVYQMKANIITPV